jgi:malonyl-CoA O-methyltransferase
MEVFNMKIQNEFSQNAKTYDKFNIIQGKIVEVLLSKICDSPESILDIGCGSGGVYNSLSWPIKQFVGIDFAEGMLDIHPKSENVDIFIKDFNLPDCFEDFVQYDFDRIISASALQWASDLDKTLKNIAAMKVPVTLAIFTSGTFKTLHKTASIPPLLRSSDEVKALCEKYFNAHYEVMHYDLEFSSVREMFKYMKGSGVGGGRNLLNYKQMKILMKNYPLDYLEWEILIVSEAIAQR